jgi:ParB-like chromosome segregation protein Spo0J
MTSNRLSFHESPFNINYHYKDTAHIEVLKKQILAGDEIPIHVYTEEDVFKIIDGGHTYAAYKDLGIEPKNIIIKVFDNDADKLAFSRHRNLNRLKQSRVLSTSSWWSSVKA